MPGGSPRVIRPVYLLTLHEKSLAVVQCTESYVHSMDIQETPPPPQTHEIGGPPPTLGG